MAPPLSTFILLLLLISSSPLTTSTTTTTTTTTNTTLSTIKTLCRQTPHPDICFNSLKLSISITPPSLLSFILQSLTAALSSATALIPVLSSSHFTEHQAGAVQDCRDLHQITISSLRKSSELLQYDSPNDNKKRLISDVRTHLSAALTNKNTCLDGLDGAGAPGPDRVVALWTAAYRPVSNVLALASGIAAGPAAPVDERRRGTRFPSWVSAKDQRLLDAGDYEGHDPALILTVAADGSENFTTISEAINFAPNSSDDRTFIIIRAGVYVENVEVAVYKTNIVLLGEGSDVTVIRGNRSTSDGWTTFRSATVAVSGQGFLARDLTFENTAGPMKGQAVALRINADLSAVYRCSIDGYQDTLYVHSFRQFYRDCDISGTIDFIFGNAAVILQNCNIYAKLPLPGHSIVVTAQSRDDPNELTGISIQNCSIVPSDELAASEGLVRTYLGRPWRDYATTVYIESYMDRIVDPSGWTKWTASDNDDGRLSTLYYGEYMNYGDGAETGGRVNWTGFHLMEYDEAFNFTVSEFIYGDEWLDSTSFPYDDGI